MFFSIWNPALIEPVSNHNLQPARIVAAGIVGARLQLSYKSG